MTLRGSDETRARNHFLEASDLSFISLNILFRAKTFCWSRMGRRVTRKNKKSAKNVWSVHEDHSYLREYWSEMERLTIFRMPWFSSFFPKIWLLWRKRVWEAERIKTNFPCTFCDDHPTDDEGQNDEFVIKSGKFTTIRKLEVRRIFLSIVIII